MNTNFHVSFNKLASTELGIFITNMLAEICNWKGFLVFFYFRIYARHIDVYVTSYVTLIF
jgi:hypothetical protein